MVRGVGLGAVDAHVGLRQLEARGALCEGRQGGLENLPLQLVLFAETIDKLEGEVVIINRMPDGVQSPCSLLA
jgi:hypothetical protein